MISWDYGKSIANIVSDPFYVCDPFYALLCHLLCLAIQAAHQLGNPINTVHADGALTFDCGGLSLGMTLAELYEDVIGDQLAGQHKGE